MPLELTDDGLSIQTLDEIRTELQDAFTDPTTGVSPDLDVSDNALFGRLIGVMAERELSLQQQIQGVYDAAGPDATGESLTRVALLTGTIRRDADYSTVTATVNLAAGFTLPAGSQANVDGDPNAVFATDDDVTNSGGSAANVAVTMTAIASGPVRAPAGTLTAITTPLLGWNSITNAADAILGDPDETDPELRVRRITELNTAASSNLAAIVTDVKAVENVESAKGYENVYATTNVDGLPPHSFEIVIFGNSADDDAVAQAIWDAQPAGIAAVHGTAGTIAQGEATDVEGDQHTIYFTRATVVPVYITVDLTIDPDEYPADGDAQVAQALIDYINDAAAIDRDVNPTKLYAPIYSIAGAVDVTALYLGTSSSPVGTTTVVIGSREIAFTDALSIVVNSTP